jgi:hypothetical protein
MENITELGVGGIFCVLILNLVFNFIEKQKIKKGGGSATSFLTNPARDNPIQKLQSDMKEIHDVLLAPPPRESLVATIKSLGVSAERNAQGQRETVAVLEDIRSILKSQAKLLEQARCEGRDVSMQKKM